MSGLLYAIVAYSLLASLLCFYLFNQLSTIRFLDMEIERHNGRNFNEEPLKEPSEDF